MGWFSWVGDIFDEAVDFLSDVVDFVVDTVSDVVGWVGDLLTGWIDVPDVPNAEEQNRGVKVDKQGTNNSLPVVYGRRRISGSRVFVTTGGADNKYLYVALALAEGEINRVTEIFVDDKIAWTGSTTHGGRFSANQGKFAGWMKFEAFHGKNDQTVAPLLSGVGGWTNEHRLKGVAYLAIQYEWYPIESNEDRDNSPWGGGIPRVQVILEGKKVKDASTLPDSVSRTTAYGDETTTYTTNPISCLLDYLRNPIFGKGMINSKFDFSTFREEAIRWKTLSTGGAASGDQLQEMNMVVFTDRTIMSNVKTMLFDMRGAMPFQQGRFHIRIEDNRDPDSVYGSTSTPVMTVGEDSIIGDISIACESVTGKYNRVTVSYPGGVEDNYITNEFVDYTYPPNDVADAYETGFEDFAGVDPGTEDLTSFKYPLEVDNGRINEHKVTLESITQDSVARKWAQTIFLKSRLRNKILNFNGDASLHELQVMDIFRFVYSPLGIDGNFRVKQLTLNSDYTFSVVAEEHNDVIYGGDIEAYSRTKYVVNVSGTDVPIYYDLANNRVVQVGNKADAGEIEVTNISGTNFYNGISYNTIYDRLQTVLGITWDGSYSGQTQDYIESGLTTNEIVGAYNSQVYSSQTLSIPTPNYLSHTLSDGGSEGTADLEISFVAVNEPNIARTRILRWNAKAQTYVDLCCPTNERSAASDGFVKLNDFVPGPESTMLFKVQFQSENSQIVATSQEISVDVSAYISDSTSYEGEVILYGASATWNDLTTDTWAQATDYWNDPTNAFPGATITKTSDGYVDVGRDRWVYPITNVSSFGPVSITTSYEVCPSSGDPSDDNDYTNTAVGALYGRYFKTTIDADAIAVYSVLSEFRYDTKTLSYSFNTTALNGDVNGRFLDLSQDFSVINNVMIMLDDADTTVSNIFIDVVESDPASFEFVIRDASNSNAAVNKTLTMTVYGLPAVELIAESGAVKEIK